MEIPEPKWCNRIGTCEHFGKKYYPITKCFRYYPTPKHSKCCGKKREHTLNYFAVQMMDAIRRNQNV